MPLPTRTPQAALVGLVTRSHPDESAIDVVLRQVGARVPAAPPGPRPRNYLQAARRRPRPEPRPITADIETAREGAREAHTVTILPRLDGSPEQVRGGIVRRALSADFDVIVARETNAVELTAGSAGRVVAPSAPGTVAQAWSTPALGLAVGMIWDLTCGQWPKMCDQRLAFHGDGGEVMRTCTRRTEHRGRHAAGDGVFIVAVWGEKYTRELVDEVAA